MSQTFGPTPQTTITTPKPSPPLTTSKTKLSPVVKSSPKTDAPMLNYIFDTHSVKGKHHHHDYKWGPHFDETDSHLNGSTVTVQIGGTALINCRVIYLQDKTVSDQIYFTRN